MPRDDWEETTQVRMIRAEAKIAASEEGVNLLKAVARMADDIKEEMRNHFASKAELSDWVLKLHKEGDNRTRQLIGEHVSRDHKASIAPSGRVSMIPKARLSGGQKSALIGALVGLLSAIGYAIKVWVGQ